MRDFSTAFLAHVLALISFVLDHRNASSARGHDLEKDQHMQKTLSTSELCANRSQDRIDYFGCLVATGAYRVDEAKKWANGYSSADCFYSFHFHH